jgi:hypothetical protein
MENKASYVCFKCGKKHLTKEQLNENNVATFFLGKCDLCKKAEAVTHIRNFNYLKNK